MNETENRRPLASRGTRWAQALTRWLVATSITPNRISQASVFFAALAGAAFWLSGPAEGFARILLLIVAALFVQLRLLCNLMDGLVAVEGGKASADGAFWNEFPDRIADILILAGAGYGAGEPALGWAAAAMAVLTAYTRELGRACGTEADFSGPMAKPHRMAMVTFAAIVAIFEPLWGGGNTVLTIALWIIAVGALATSFRRAYRLVKTLNG